MTRLAGKTGFVLLLAIFISPACKKEYSCENCIPVNNPDPVVNRPPQANAGADQIITLPLNKTDLDGSLSTDPDGNIVSYSWNEISGQPTVTFGNANAAQTWAGNFASGIHFLELTVTDAGGLASTDTVKIIVNPAPVESRWMRQMGVFPYDFFNSGTLTFDENLLVGINEQLFVLSMKGDLWQHPSVKIGALPGFATNINVSVVFGIENRGYFIGAGLSWVYDASTREITKKTNTPTGNDRIDHSIPLVIGKKAYLVGSTNNHVTVYDPASDTYTRLKNFPGKGAVTGFRIEQYGYYLEEDGTCWRYDPVTDQWQQKTGVQQTLFNQVGFSLNGYGYMLGDLSQAQANGQMFLWQYDPGSDSWEKIDDNYPGYGIRRLKSVSMITAAYVGFGYMEGDFYAADIWSFR